MASIKTSRVTCFEYKQARFLWSKGTNRLLLVVSVALISLGLTFSSEAENIAVDKTGQFLGVKEAKHPDWFKESFLDFSEDIEEARVEGKRLVLYFWQPGCPYCNQLWERNMSVKGIERAFKSKYDVVAINMWGDREVITVQGKLFTEKQLAKALKVNFTPTLQFYDEQKNPMLRLNGYIPPDRFKHALHYASGETKPNQSFNQYVFSQTSSDQGVLIDEPFYLPYENALANRSKLGSKRPLAVIFETPDCEDCKRFHSVTLKHSDTRNLLKQMDVVRLNARSEQAITKPDGSKSSAKQWAETLDLSYYPSIAFFDKAGNQVMLMDAYFRNFHTQSIFAYVLEEAYKNEPSFQRYLSARADHLIERGLDVDIWEE